MWNKQASSYLWTNNVFWSLISEPPINHIPQPIQYRKFVNLLKLYIPFKNIFFKGYFLKNKSDYYCEVKGFQIRAFIDIVPLSISSVDSCILGHILKCWLQAQIHSGQKPLVWVAEKSRGCGYDSH